MLDYYSSKKIIFRPHFLFAKISSRENYFSSGRQEHLQLLSSFHGDKLALHSDSNSTEQIPKSDGYEVLSPIKGRMEPRDTFQNFYHRQFSSLTNKVLGPNLGNKIFSKYYHYCHFVYIKCAIIVHLNTELYHNRKNQKKNWMDAKINLYTILDTVWF